MLHFHGKDARREATGLAVSELGNRVKVAGFTRACKEKDAPSGILFNQTNLYGKSTSD